MARGSPGLAHRWLDGSAVRRSRRGMGVPRKLYAGQQRHGSCRETRRGEEPDGEERGVVAAEMSPVARPTWVVMITKVSVVACIRPATWTRWRPMKWCRPARAAAHNEQGEQNRAPR